MRRQQTLPSEVAVGLTGMAFFALFLPALGFWITLGNLPQIGERSERPVHFYHRVKVDGHVKFIEEARND